MKITVLRKMRYQNTFIYIMQFSTLFQYLFAWNGEIYQNNIKMRPSSLNFLKWKLGLANYPYTTPELEEGEHAILSGAMETIDKIIADGTNTRQARREKEREIAQIEQAVIDKADKDCVWQAFETKGGFYYQCLIHGFAVKMIDGEKPAHEKLIPSPYNSVKSNA